MLQPRAFAARGDSEVRDAVRASFGRPWRTVGVAAELEPVQVKTFLAYGALLSTKAASDLADVDEPWAEEVRTGPAAVRMPPSNGLIDPGVGATFALRPLGVRVHRGYRCVPGREAAVDETEEEWLPELLSGAGHRPRRRRSLPWRSVPG
ncbi:MAG: hypothetical protein J2P20_14885 [Pseudonocardia sp.]|nr:hypothetical protein [Pseudonocardia sp.]MBO0874250.1 hypothetical protein [Pseudonocardia sp.]